MRLYSLFPSSLSSFVYLLSPTHLSSHLHSLKLTFPSSSPSLTFAGASSNESRCFSQVIVDLHISPEHNQSFDQLYVVHLSNRVTEMLQKSFVSIGKPLYKGWNGSRDPRFSSYHDFGVTAFGSVQLFFLSISNCISSFWSLDHFSHSSVLTINSPREFFFV